MTPVTDVRDISHIAYGFIGSKALFAALNLDLFSLLADGPLGVDDLSVRAGVPPARLLTLLTTLTCLGLLSTDGDGYANAPAAQRYLVRGAPGDFGDYYRFQIDGQIYPALLHLDAGLAGDDENLAHDGFAGLMSDPEEAESFTRAQHAGSLGPALMLSRQLDLSGRRRLLDVAGGSGAFSIVLCQRNPELRAAVLDFPHVVDVARRFVSENGLSDRIDLLAGDARTIAWPTDQDVVLMSYLLSAVSPADQAALVQRAWDILQPDGEIAIHDFMLDDDRSGPRLTSFWFLQYLAYNPRSTSFTGADVRGLLRSHGFTDVDESVTVPEITKLVTGRKPT